MKCRIRLKSPDLRGLTCLQEELGRAQSMGLVSSYDVPSFNLASVLEIVDVEIEGAHPQMFGLLDLDIVSDDNRAIGEIIAERSRT